MARKRASARHPLEASVMRPCEGRDSVRHPRRALRRLTIGDGDTARGLVIGGRTGRLRRGDMSYQNFRRGHVSLKTMLTRAHTFVDRAALENANRPRNQARHMVHVDTLRLGELVLSPPKRITAASYDALCIGGSGFGDTYAY